MAKKTENPSGPANDGLWESTNRIWLAGLAAFARAQEEGNKLFDTLVQEGERLQRQGQQHSEPPLEEMLEGARHTWDQLGQIFETQVAAALGRLGVPSQRDIQALSRRIEDLNRKLEELQK